MWGTKKARSVRDWTLILMLLSAACAEDPRAQVVVVFDAESSLEERARCLLVDLSDADGTPLDPVLVDLQSESPLPIRLPLHPAGDDASRRYQLRAELFSENCNTRETSLGVQELASGYVADQTRELRVRFATSCEDVTCPDGFRCNSGECVEHCLAPTVPGEVEQSEPVACGEPCAADSCDPDAEQALRCDTTGYVALKLECGFGCGEVDCRQVRPSNVGDVFAIEQGRSPLVVERNRVVINTDDGTIAEFDGSGTMVRELRPSGVGEDAGIRFEHANSDTTLRCRDIVGNPVGPPFSGSYGVFWFDALTIDEDATVEGTGSRALVLLVDRNIRVDGTLSVAATSTSPGPGGFHGAETGGTIGPGTGNDGEAPGMPPERGGGGGGGSHSTLAGQGGDAAAGPEGGFPGCVYGTESLEPLIGGSGGGASGDTPPAPGGHGGGALQMSTNGRIFIGASGVINAGGSGGGISGIVNSGAGGGGSGGTVLLEAGTLVFEGMADGLARIGATGGGGASTGVPGDDGHPHHVPALGGIDFGGTGGIGSSDVGFSGSGNDGRLMSGGFGGGGAAGLIRINTRAGNEDFEAFLSPKSTFFPLATVGEADVHE